MIILEISAPYILFINLLADYREQEAICSLHSGRKQLESTRNPKQEQICIKKHKTLDPGVTPLYGLNGDVQPDRVWFSEGFVLNGVSNSSIFALNRVLLHDLMYSLTYRNLTTSRIFTSLPMRSVLK